MALVIELLDVVSMGVHVLIADSVDVYSTFDLLT